jgi:hypothetical protein
LRRLKSIAAVVAAAAVGVFVATGCEARTTPVTTTGPDALTATTARLNGEGRCDGTDLPDLKDMHFKIRQVGASNWTVVPGNLKAGEPPNEGALTHVDCGTQATGLLPVHARVTGLQPGTTYEYALSATFDNTNYLCAADTFDEVENCNTHNNTYSTFTTADANGPVPNNATLIDEYDFDSAGPWAGLKEQCGDSDDNGETPPDVTHGVDNGDGYAHFEVPASGVEEETGNERCEVGYGSNNRLPAGEYWFRIRQRVGQGFPRNDPNPSGNDSWAIISQWHEPEAPDNGEVDLALHTGNTVERTFFDGQFLAGPGDTAFDHDYNQWHTYTVHVNFSTNPALGFAQYWVDDQPVGQINGRTASGDASHYWKVGIYRGTQTNHLQTSDVSFVEIWEP